jgi:obg-like ATPase 1
VRDLEIISTELIKKDLQFVEKRLDELDNKIKRFNERAHKEEKECLDHVKKLLEEGKWIKNHNWNASDVEWLNTHLFLTAKPVVYMVNLSAKDYQVY